MGSAMSTVDGGRASECPDWCVVDHAEGNAEPHTSEGREVSVDRLTAIPGERSRAQSAPMVVTMRRDGEGEWIYVGDGTDQHLELSVESWRRVIGALRETLDRFDAKR